MSKSPWSEDLQEATKCKIYEGAVVKDAKWNHGIYTINSEKKIEIKALGKAPFPGIPVCGEETIATYNNLTEMINDGWVID